MKNSFPSSRRAALVLALPLFLFSSSLFAATKPETDRAAEYLAATGSLPLSSVGPYVELGTYQIQVRVKLGQPDARLADGTWLYHRRQIDGSNAEGTLVIRFTRGQVSNLLLATPVMVAALNGTPSDPQHALAGNQR